MQSCYLLPLLCVAFCAVAKCETTTGLDCQTEKLAGETENLPTENSANDYYCPDGVPANYDGQSGKHHCCTMSLRQGKCPGECRELRSKRSMVDLPRNFGRLVDNQKNKRSLIIKIPTRRPYVILWPWERPIRLKRPSESTV